MTACNQAQGSYQQLPAGTKLEVWTEGDATAFSSACDIVGPVAAEDVSFNHQQLVNQAPPNAPNKPALTGGTAYFVRFTVTFHTNGVTRAHLGVRVSQGGTQIRPRIHCWIEGKAANGTMSQIFFVSTN
ncbi:MAG: hypothetical protein DWQ36_14685 [Acidobacteria bacterium]|mgnify:CR=1 FL=1|nr:MAG: hypothetical protein DWQ30_03420 [Acidobacteriota bacterium]REK06138.1 MAG: hypothetical protein DWQ36_14685 [Acidobacteriota bacterium]